MEGSLLVITGHNVHGGRDTIVFDSIQNKNHGRRKGV